MSSISIALDSSPSASFLLQLANSAALDEISNVQGCPSHYIRNRGLVHSSTGKTQRALLFVVYQTGRHGPQNGFRLCLVNEGFQIGHREALSTQQVNTQALEVLEGEIVQDAMEYIVLGGATEGHVNGVNGA